MKLDKHFNVIVVGASGYIGQELLLRAKAIFPKAYGTSTKGINGLKFLNFDSQSSFDLTSIQVGDVIFLAAAISAPDVCARDFDYAWKINVTQSAELIDRLISRGARIIFLSSDTVYGECKNLINESAKENPAGEYAEMKMGLESLFKGNPLFKVVRLSYVFSREDKFTKYLLDCANSRREAELFHPFYRAIIHRDDVIDALLALAKNWDEFPQQLINFGGPEVLSRVDFAQCLKQKIMPDLRFNVIQPTEEFFKNRPRVIAMSSMILPKILGRPSRTLSEAVNIEFNL